jgi:hypothetical protein
MKMIAKPCTLPGLLLAALIVVLCASCGRSLGWGVLLWSTEDPAIPSGTILPVFIRSNIDQVWVVGIPELYQGAKEIDKFEVPLAQLEFTGTKNAARKRAAAFSEYALTYAETLQDGLPIREDTDNNTRRVYRLKMGQIVKILSQAEGNPAISTTGDPLPGEWYRVLTEDGVIGYCFSYRLRLFDHAGGVLALNTEAEQAEQDDADLERSPFKAPGPVPNRPNPGVGEGPVQIRQVYPGKSRVLSRREAPVLRQLFGVNPPGSNHGPVCFGVPGDGQDPLQVRVFLLHLLGLGVQSQDPSGMLEEAEPV